MKTLHVTCHSTIMYYFEQLYKHIASLAKTFTALSHSLFRPTQVPWWPGGVAKVSFLCHSGVHSSQTCVGRLMPPWDKGDG